MDVDHADSGATRDEHESQCCAEDECPTRCVFAREGTGSRRAPPRDLRTQGLVDRASEVLVELPHDEELHRGTDFLDRMGKGIEHADEALTVRRCLEKSRGGEEFEKQAAQHRLSGLGPCRCRQLRAIGVAILQGPARGARLASHPCEGEIAPAFLRRHAHGGSTQRAVGAPDTRRHEEVGHPLTLLRKTPYRPASRGRATRDCSRGSRSAVICTSNSIRPAWESTIHRA